MCVRDFRSLSCIQMSTVEYEHEKRMRNELEVCGKGQNKFRPPYKYLPHRQMLMKED